MELRIERILWNSRYVVMLPVAAALLLALLAFITSTFDALVLAGKMIAYLTTDTDLRGYARLNNITEIVAVIDGYLLAAILLIFSLGIYELFVNKINAAEGSEFASRLLLIRSLDDLKDRLANVILLILIVKFFQTALNTSYETATDVLYLAVGIILVAGTLYLSGRAKPVKPPVNE